MPNDNPDHNIIQFQPRPPKPEAPKKPKHPPMFNIPPATKFLTGAILVVHVILFALTNTVFPEAAAIASYFGGFTPASWTGGYPFQFWTPLTLISFSFLHGGWMHLAFNVVMLVAMGSGLEKSIGIRKYLMVYVVSTVFAMMTHFALYPTSTMPIIGASGGISGVFGAMIVVMSIAQRQAGYTGKSTLMPTIIAYIGITVVMGLMGSPDGATVAWVAHIGGFLAGVGIMLTLLKRQK